MSKPNLTAKAVEQATASYRKEHGEFPTAKSGDASDHFGFPETWGAVDSALRNGGRDLPGGDSLPK